MLTLYLFVYHIQGVYKIVDNFETALNFTKSIHKYRLFGYTYNVE